MEGYAKIGGILNIISGSVTICTGLIFPGLIIFMFLIMQIAEPDSTEFIPLIVVGVIYGIIGFFYIIAGVFTIIGGAFAIKEKHWVISLTASIIAAYTFFPCGVASIILITMARESFSSSKTEQVTA